MVTYLPIVEPTFCSDRLALIFPRQAFDTVLSGPLAGAAVAAMIYVGAVQDDDEAAEQRYARPTTVLWLSSAILSKSTDAERDAWYDAASHSNQRVVELEASWGITHRAPYKDNSRETLRDETLPGWRDQGALLMKAGLATSSSRPRWQLARHFAELFNPGLTGDTLADAIADWTEKHMSTSGKIKAKSLHALAQSAHSVDVLLPDGKHRQLEGGEASQILKGVIEEWAPRKLKWPMVLSISEPGDKVYLADKSLLAQVGIEIDPAKLLPDALIVDVGTEAVEFWIVEAVASDGEINEGRKSKLLEWAAEQGIHASACRFLTAFSSRNAPPARRRLKDLAGESYAWFLAEPDHELKWGVIEASSGKVKLATVTPIL